jgi:transposase
MLMSLAKVPVAALEPRMIALLKALYVQGYFGSICRMARMLNIARRTARAIVSLLPSEMAAPPKERNRAQAAAARIKQRLVLEAWAALDRPATEEVREYLRRQSGVEVLKRHVRKICTRVGLVCKRPSTQQLLTELDKTTRLEFAKKLLERSELFPRLVFSDEKIFVCPYGEAKIGWCQPKQTPHVKQKVLHPPKRMVWLGIGDFGDRWTTNAFWYAEGVTQDGPLYVETLKQSMRDIARGLPNKPIL